LVVAEMKVGVSHSEAGFDGEIIVHSKTYLEFIDTFLVESSGEINLGSEQIAVPSDEILTRVHNF